jgi:hypothetical protein
MINGFTKPGGIVVFSNRADMKLIPIPINRFLFRGNLSYVLLSLESPADPSETFQVAHRIQGYGMSISRSFLRYAVVH